MIGRNQLTMIRVWSVISCIFAVLHAVMSLRSGKTPAPLPAYLSYLWVGGLGVLVVNALASQQRRISDLEQVLSKRS